MPTRSPYQPSPSETIHHHAEARWHHLTKELFARNPRPLVSSGGRIFGNQYFQEPTPNTCYERIEERISSQGNRLRSQDLDGRSAQSEIPVPAITVEELENGESKAEAVEETVRSVLDQCGAFSQGARLQQQESGKRPTTGPLRPQANDYLPDHERAFRFLADGLLVAKHPRSDTVVNFVDRVEYEPNGELGTASSFGDITVQLQRFEWPRDQYDTDVLRSVNFSFEQAVAFRPATAPASTGFRDASTPRWDSMDDPFSQSKLGPKRNHRQAHHRHSASNTIAQIMAQAGLSVANGGSELQHEPWQQRQAGSNHRTNAVAPYRYFQRRIPKQSLTLARSARNFVPRCRPMQAAGALALERVRSPHVKQQENERTQSRDGRLPVLSHRHPHVRSEQDMNAALPVSDDKGLKRASGLEPGSLPGSTLPATPPKSNELSLQGLELIMNDSELVVSEPKVQQDETLEAHKTATAASSLAKLEEAAHRFELQKAALRRLLLTLSLEQLQRINAIRQELQAAERGDKNSVEEAPKDTPAQSNASPLAIMDKESTPPDAKAPGSLQSPVIAGASGANTSSAACVA